MQVKEITQGPFVCFAWWLEPTVPTLIVSSLPPNLSSGVPLGQKPVAVPWNFRQQACTCPLQSPARLHLPSVR